jgi:hypothetical protein
VAITESDRILGTLRRGTGADYEREANSRGSLRLSAQIIRPGGTGRTWPGVLGFPGPGVLPRIAAVARGELTGAAPGWWPCSRMHRGDGAYHAVAEAGGADAERQVEAAAHVLQGDVVRQFHDLAVVEVLAKPVE